MVNNPMEKYLGVIITVTYQDVVGDRRWVYESVLYLWLDSYPDSKYSDDKSGLEGITY